MNHTELKRLAALGEGAHLEFKRRVPAPERISKEVVAFANTRGGKLLLGVDDDGTVRGLKDVGEELYVLESALQASCDPPVDVRIRQVPISRRREVLIVDVPESRNKPHFVVDSDDRRTAYVRVRDHSVEASREAVKLMKWEQNPKDTHFEFGPKEHLLLRYLDQYGRITVSQFARVGRLPRRRASWKLLLLARAGILRHNADVKEDFFTLAAQPT